MNPLRSLLVLLVLLVPASCRTAPPPAGRTHGFPTELAQPATVAGQSTKPAATSTPRTKPAASATATTKAPASASTAAFALRGSHADASGDAGAKAPAYADMIRVAVESNGTNARVTVTMGAAIPAAMGSEEEEAVGVDLFGTPSQPESDYQLYAMGDSTGWVAYLDAPDGFVRYPGSFEVMGAALVFTVPWSSLGGMRAGYASAFMDWDRKGTVLNDVGGDHLPDEGKLRYR